MAEAAVYDQFWWNQSKGNRFRAVFPYLKKLDMKQGLISELNLRHIRLYGNMDLLGIRVGQFHRNKSNTRVTLNVVKAVTDTVTAKIAQKAPKPTFLTDGGDWRYQQKAKKLEDFSNGSLYQSGTRKIGAKIFRDGGVFGTGIIHYYFERSKDGKKSKICSERVFPEEIKVDQDEAIYGEPRQIHRQKFIPREVLKAMYPKYKTEIDQAKSKMDGAGFLYDNTNPDMILVVESYHLPSGEGEKDGVHLISIETADLFSEEWEYDWWPFEFFHYDQKLLGFWGMGIPELLTGIQIEINKILIRISDIMHLGSVPKIFMERGSKIVKSRFNNLIGNIIEYSGTMPEMKALMNVPVDLFNQLSVLYEKAFEMAGVSQLSAQSTKPPGLDSGKALREFNDIETERFMTVGKEWENFHLRCTELLIKMAKRENEHLKKDGGKGFFIKNPGETGINTIHWDEVDMDEDSYIMQIYPTNLFSTTPSARLSEVTELLSVGFFSKEEANALIQYPDVRYEASLQNAQFEDINAMIDAMIYDGKYEVPEPFQNLKLGLPMVQDAYLKYKRMSAPKKNLELLIDWMNAATEMLNQAQAAEQAALADAQAQAAASRQPIPPGNNVNLQQAAA